MNGTAERTQPSGIRTVLEVAGVTVLSFVIAVVAGVAFIVPVFVLGYDIESTVVLLASTTVGQVAMAAVGYGYLRYRDVSISIRRPSLSAVGYVLAGVVVALLAAIGLSVLLTVLDLVPDSVIGDAAATDPTFLLGLAALSVVLVAPVEEFVFRGVVQGRLRERFGPIAAVVGSSLLFGSMHLANYSGAFLPIVAGVFLIAAIGAVLGTLYELTDNLAVPIAVHAIYNVVLMLISYVAATSM